MREASEQSGVDGHARVTAALEGRLDPGELREEEAAAWLDAFTEKTAKPARSEQAFFAERRQIGRGVGLDAAGNLVHAREKADR